ncbi:DUF2891 domain-containing protein [Chryseobacterium sp. POL2]|uniref:DUF2891 domain-containing protein n=1 Tax=Chryseobacterium sp. POL2 TaxID=2713414 RepID=UPI0013E1C768|nr:DUF2891 domain-containing protein [Chryseobacterium sp. POL2]QIG89037.1 DUF2891 domain-containing protein [Chryseobacterium sp. POL2]
MKYLGLLLLIPSTLAAQKTELSDQLANQLATMPLKCIQQEYPNKTAHIINSVHEVSLRPSDLHPSFYGCFDWHSSVHGHWMLVKILKEKPNIFQTSKIERILDQSFTAEALKKEALYFTKYDLAKNFERTYGWAWLLKLDEELATWQHPKAKVWHQNMKLLTDEILRLWKTYLPKQTYPNRTGVHSNSAFAMGFAIDWARKVGDKDFENQLVQKAKDFYLKDEKTPAYLEPDGSDFFSPSLEIADLMRRVLSQKDFEVWINNFYDKKSIDNISKIPIVSDLEDYQTVHLVGLSFSKAWCMKSISKALPERHPLKNAFAETSEHFLEKALPMMAKSNYGGDHWLASFAVFAIMNQD